MSDVYVYDAKSRNWDNIGICGALSPTEVKFNEIANGKRSISLKHPIDSLGKYKCLQHSNLLKVAVPVRNVPEIDDEGHYVTKIIECKTKNATSDYQRAIWDNGTIGGNGECCKKIVPVGETINVLSMPADTSKYRGYVNYTCWDYVRIAKRKKKWIYGWAYVTIDGWMDVSADVISYNPKDTHPDGKIIPVDPSPDGIENVLEWSLKFQMFRITSVKKTDSEVTVEADCVSYDMMYNVTTYDTDQSVSLRNAISGILSGCIDKGNIGFISSNINVDLVGHHWANKDPITAMLDPDMGEVARVGGSVVRNDNKLTILDKIGINRGVIFEYGKNIEGIDMSVDISKLATAIRPSGKYENGVDIYLTTDYYLDAQYNVVHEQPGNGIIYSPFSPNNSYTASTVQHLPMERIYALEGSDCTVSDKVPYPTVLQRLQQQSIDSLKNGSDMPEINVDIDIVQLEASEEYARYSDIEKVFLFDTVRVRYPLLDIDITTTVSEIEWDCISDRLLNVKLGSITALTASVASWQISSLNGTKIISGTVTGSAMADNSISARTILADAISTDALQANCVTANKVAAGAIETEKIKANAVKAGQIDANSVASAVLDTQVMSAGIANIVTASIGNASIGYAQIKDASAETLFTKDGNADRYYIEKFAATSAQIESMMVGQLVFRASDDKYYTLDASVVDGNVKFTPTLYTGGFDESGKTTDGKRYLFSETINVEDLTAADIHATDALITRIRSDQLFANHAFLNKLTTKEIFSDGTSLNVMSTNVHNALEAATTADANAQTALEKVSQKITTYYSASEPEGDLSEGDLWIKVDENLKVKIYRRTGQSWIILDDKGLADLSVNVDSLRGTLGKYFDFDSSRGLIVKGLNPDGTQSPFYTITSNDGFAVRSMAKADDLGSFGLDGLTTIGVTMGRMTLRPTSRGIVFVTKKEE